MWYVTLILHVHVDQPARTMIQDTTERFLNRPSYQTSCEENTQPRRTANSSRKYIQREA